VTKVERSDKNLTFLLLDVKTELKKSQFGFNRIQTLADS